MNESRKAKFYDHLGLKFLALLIAFIMWFIVMNLEDSTTTKTITDITVEMLNGDSITENGNLYNITDGETISIVVKGPRSIVEGLDASNFTATADLSHLSVTNSTTIDVATNSTVSLKNAKKLTITPIDEYVTLSIEEEVEKSVPVKVITTGSVRSGYALGNATSTPNMVTVSGPESVVASIVEARAVVDVSNADKNITTKASLGCIDGYGTAIEKDNITIGTTDVKINIPVYETKEIPINVSTIGNPHEGYGVRTINYEPTSVVVAGTSDVLDGIESIEIKDVVISDAVENIEKNINLEEYLPSECFLADEANKEVAISVEIEQFSEIEINLSKSDIVLSGQRKDRSYIIKSPESIKVKLTGFSEDIEDITKDDINPRIAVGDIALGEHEVSLELTKKDTYSYKEDYKVIVEVEAKE